MGELMVKVPWLYGDTIVQQTATIKDRKWTAKNRSLFEALCFVHLRSGHHADRDLELARMVAARFGGKVIDTREQREHTELPN